MLQGLFERHKLIVATQLAMLVLRKAGELSAQKFDFLLRGPQRAGVTNPVVEWLPDSIWASVQALKVRLTCWHGAVQKIGAAFSTCLQRRWVQVPAHFAMQSTSVNPAAHPQSSQSLSYYS